MSPTDRAATHTSSEWRARVEQVFMGPACCVIVPSFDATHADYMKRRFGIPVLLFNGRREHITVEQGAVPLADISSPPTCPSILAACSEAGAAELEPFRQWWSHVSGSPSPPAMRFPSDTPPDAFSLAILNAIVDLYAQANRRSAQIVVDLHQQIVALRRQNEDAWNIIKDLRTQIGAAPTPTIIVETMACGSTEDETSELAYRFPLSVWGLSQIDLHFSGPADGTGTVGISIIGSENDALLGQWRIPYRHATGWVQLCLPEALSVQNYELIIRIAFLTEGGLPPRLSLSSDHLYVQGPSRFQLTTTPLRLPVIRLWSWIPTLRQPAPFWVGAAQARGTDSAEYA